MRVATVYACVKVISETIASLPVFIYRRKADGTRKVEQKAPAHFLLHESPNSAWTQFEFKEYLEASVLLTGNGYCWKEFNNAGQLISLWPLDTNGMEFEIGINSKGAKRIVKYTYNIPETSEKVEFEQGEIWHLKDLIGPDGVSGLSRIGQARNTIGISMSADQFASKFYANDANPSGILEYPGVLQEDVKKGMQKSWDELHQGSSKAFKTALLEGGVKFTPLTLSQEDSQFIETRSFQVADVARIFRVPTIMIGGAGDADKSNTYASAEQQMLSFVQHTIRPWLVRWESSIKLNLFTEKERKNLFAEFKIEGLLRADIKTRYEAYQIGRNNSFLSVNDIRRLENMDLVEVDGADDYVMPSNFRAIDEEPVTEPVQGQLPMDDDTGDEETDDE
jgi:HK97 family phage portal protein